MFESEFNFKQLICIKLVIFIPLGCYLSKPTNGHCYKNNTCGSKKGKYICNKMPSCVVFMQTFSSHLSVCCICLWVLFCDSFAMQQSEIDDICPASVEAWNTVQSMSYNVPVPLWAKRCSTLNNKSIVQRTQEALSFFNIYYIYINGNIVINVNDHRNSWMIFTARDV